LNEAPLPPRSTGEGQDGLSPRTFQRDIGRVIGAALLLLGATVVSAPPALAQPLRSTVVSITVDDGLADAVAAAALLDRHGMKGTFYVNTGTVDTPGHLSRDQVRQLAAAGHEIGGHSVLHPLLTSVAPDEIRREICLDRQNLLDWGLRPISFAYPFGAADDGTAKIAAECGYDNARTVGDLASRSPLCKRCAVAETIPPANPYLIRTSDDIDPTWKLADLEAQVEAAMTTGGWLPLVLHAVCDGCSTIGFEPQTLAAFLDWLEAQRSAGVVVKTVGEVVSGPLRPVPASSFGKSTQPSALGPVATDGLPACWTLAGFGRNTVSHDVQPGPQPAVPAIRLSMRDHVDGNAKLVPALDLGECAPAATPGVRYQLTTNYTSDVPVQTDVYYRNTVGRWTYWTSSPFFDPSTSWTQATWTTPPMPADTTGISFGLALGGDGSMTVAGSTLQPQPPDARFSAWLPWLPGLGGGVAALAALAALRAALRRRTRRP
jgi:peptidoglycan/xylan/chitin deacetylase (PgdA/CDA1 family)